MQEWFSPGLVPAALSTNPKSLEFLEFPTGRISAFVTLTNLIALRKSVQGFQLRCW